MGDSTYYNDEWELGRQANLTMIDKIDEHYSE
jgi:hypothetical protein